MPRTKKKETALAPVAPAPLDIRGMTVGDLLALARREDVGGEVKSLAINSLRQVIAHHTKPTGTRLLIRKIEAHQTMSDGRHGSQVHLPDKYQELDNYAEVLHVGDEVTKYKPGDVIYIWGGAGAFLLDDLVLIEQKEVLGVVDLGEAPR